MISEIALALAREERRQQDGVELIPSENYTYPEVLELLGSVFTNKYSEGYPGRRYYGGQEFTDQIENLARQRALLALPRRACQRSASVWIANEPGRVSGPVEARRYDIGDGPVARRPSHAWRASVAHGAAVQLRSLQDAPFKGRGH